VGGLHFSEKNTGPHAQHKRKKCGKPPGGKKPDWRSIDRGRYEALLSQLAAKDLRKKISYLLEKVLEESPKNQKECLKK